METKLAATGKVDRRLPISAIVIVLVLGTSAMLVACGGEPSTTVASATTTVQAATTTTEKILEIQMEFNIPYVTRPGALDPPAVIHVWAPKEPGPWPVVVMVHGGGDKPLYPGGLLPLQPLKVAQRGAVVLAPVWTDIAGPSPESIADETDAKEFEAGFRQRIGEIAAAVRFARAVAARYGGDPDNVTLFGYSAGANLAVPVALGGASPAEGALAGAGSSLPESLVILDPDYLTADPAWTGLMAFDPGFFKVHSPFRYLGHPADFPITVVCSGDPGLSRELGDPWADNSWLAVRDPSGDIRRGLEGLGALSGDLWTNESAGELFTQWLKADADTVTYIRLKSSNHNTVSEGDLNTVLEALVPSARK